MTNPRMRDPFAPIEVAVTALLGIFGLSIVGFVLLAGFQFAVNGHSEVSFATVGEPSSCVVTDAGSVPRVFAGGSGVRPSEGIEGLRPSTASAKTEGWKICLNDANGLQWAAARVEPIGKMASLLVILLLIRRTIRTARQGGLFADATARGLRRLGWFLLLLAALGPFLAAAARGTVIAAAVRGESWTSQLAHPHLSTSLVCVALGILAFARILRLAIPLQEEVDATV